MHFLLKGFSDRRTFRLLAAVAVAMAGIGTISYGDHIVIENPSDVKKLSDLLLHGGDSDGGKDFGFNGSIDGKTFLFNCDKSSCTFFKPEASKKFCRFSAIWGGPIDGPPSRELREALVEGCDRCMRVLEKGCKYLACYDSATGDPLPIPKNLLNVMNPGCH